ncbi:hypothetical protein BGZ93_001054 [Podila epicladia]|nr:hypothetical protein BGZ93_001054 [Podila epicladia]
MTPIPLARSSSSSASSRPPRTMRYSPHVIAEEFYGHQHYDEFALCYGCPLGRQGATPDWNLKYSARNAYGKYTPVNATAPLSASWWHGVVVAFERTLAAFQEYWTYLGKRAKCLLPVLLTTPVLLSLCARASVKLRARRVLCLTRAAIATMALTPRLGTSAFVDCRSVDLETD